MQSGGILNQSRDTQQNFLLATLNNMKGYYEHKFHKKLPSHIYNQFSLISKDDEDRLKYSQIFQNMLKNNSFNPAQLKLDTKQSRGVATLMGLGICDALGASTEFIPFDKKRDHLIKDGFKDIEQKVKAKILDRRSGQIGIWTDDCSMAIAMADSLLYKKYQFDPVHIRYMFILWLEHGLGNGGRPYSIGLGGNISISMGQFMQNQIPYCQKGQQFNNGNGSLMRLAPVPIAYSDNIEKAIEFSGKQSETTHNGLEAQQCAKLLASIIVRLINRQKDEQWRAIIQETCDCFKSPLPAVEFLAKSQQQTQEMFDHSKATQRTFKKFNKSINDRNWNWKSADHTYSPCRLKQQPGYIGSYCMDALAMALHTVWHTKSFKECALFNANIGGDCDTVGAIAGQIAGAVYGLSEDMLRLYSQMVDFHSERYQAFLVGLKLINKQKINVKLQEVQQKVQKEGDDKQKMNIEEQVQPEKEENDSKMQIQQKMI